MIPQSSHTGPSLATLQLFPLPNSRGTPSSSLEDHFASSSSVIYTCDQSIKFLPSEPCVHGCCPMAVLDCLLSISCHDPHSSHPDLGSPRALFMCICLLEMPLCPTACLLKGPALSSLCCEQKQPYAIPWPHSTWCLASDSNHSGRCSCSPLCTVLPPSRL